MARRGQENEWFVSFAGNGEVTVENAKALLDNWLPQDADIHIYLPEGIPRGNKGLRGVQAILEDFKLDPERVEDHDLISRLVNGSGGEKYLVVLWDDDDDTVALVEKALACGITVKDLTGGLDDVELAEPESEPENKQRGKPRTEAVQATVEGPATVTSAGVQCFAQSEAELLVGAIRHIVRLELQEMGLTPGVNSFGPADSAPEVPKIKVFTNEDGEYQLAGDRKRAPRGWNSAEITTAEARDLDLL